MGRIIAVANQKGGVGKSTTAINLSACLSEAGKRVLLVDIDPQGNTTSGIGLSKEELELSVYNLLIDDADIKDVLVHMEYPKLDVLPSTIDLSGAEIELLDVQEREYRLKHVLEPLKKKYDYIYIDCPPSLSLLTINGLTAADYILVPTQCEYYALEGLALLMHTVELIQNGLNPDLKIDGVVFTMFDSRTRLSAQVVENVRNNLDVFIYDTTIPRNVRLAEAPSYGLPINIYDGRSSGAEAYRKLAQEVIHRRNF